MTSLPTACARPALAGHDLVLLLRQDGRPLSLAPFDSEAVVRAVATSTTPVLSGLGSPEEPAAVEEVAHQAYPTAYEATVSVVRRLQRARDLIEDTVLEVADARDEAMRRAARRLEQTRHRLAEDIRLATARTQDIRARRLRWIRLVAGVIALAVVAGAAVTQIWLILAGLVVPLGIALAAPRLRTKRRRPVTVDPVLVLRGADRSSRTSAASCARSPIRTTCSRSRPRPTRSPSTAGRCCASPAGCVSTRLHAAPEPGVPRRRSPQTVASSPAAPGPPTSSTWKSSTRSAGRPGQTVVLPEDPVRSQHH